MIVFIEPCQLLLSSLTNNNNNNNIFPKLIKIEEKNQ